MKIKENTKKDYILHSEASPVKFQPNDNLNSKIKELTDKNLSLKSENNHLEGIIGYLESALRSRDDTIKQYVLQVSELKRDNKALQNRINKLNQEIENLKTGYISQKHALALKIGEGTESTTMTNNIPIKKATDQTNTKSNSVFKTKGTIEYIPNARTVTESQGMQDLKTLFLFPTGPKSVLVMDETEVPQCLNSNDVVAIEKLTDDEEKFCELIQKMGLADLMKLCGIIKCLMSDFKNMLNLIMRLRKLIKASHTISGSLNLNESFQKIVEQTCSILGCDRTSVFLVDELNGELWTKIAKGSNTIRIPLDKGIAGYVATHGKTLRIEEAYADPRFNKEVDKKNNYRTKTILCVPIKDNNDRVIGVCQSINKLTGIFSMDDEGLLGLLANQAGTMLKNSMQYDKTVINQNKLRGLIDVGVHLFNCQTLQDIIFNGQRFVKDLMNTDKAKIILYNNRKDLLFTYTEEGIKVNYPPDIGIFGFVVRTKQVVDVKEATNSTLFNQQIDLISSLPILCLPLVSSTGSLSMGALQVSNMKNIFNTGGKSDFFEQEILKSFGLILSSCLEKFHKMELSAISRIKGIILEFNKKKIFKTIDSMDSYAIEKIIFEQMDNIAFDDGAHVSLINNNNSSNHSQEEISDKNTEEPLKKSITGEEEENKKKFLTLFGLLLSSKLEENGNANAENE